MATTATVTEQLPTATPPPSARERGRISGADGVRAAAALMVIAHHLAQKLAAWGQSTWLQDFTES